MREFQSREDSRHFENLSYGDAWSELSFFEKTRQQWNAIIKVQAINGNLNHKYSGVVLKLTKIKSALTKIYAARW